ncbi:MAG: DNA recombination protein RmuC [Chloroflexota bacterium]|nr:DNA recombination protein RmuC [Chloroflexota bacterium]
MEWIAALIVGVIVGGLACWIIQEQRANARLAAQGAEHRAETANLQGRLAEADSADKIIEVAEQRLRDTFQATAAKALETNNDTFLKLANENLGKTLEKASGDFNQRHEQFQALVKPLADNYAKLDPRIESLVKQTETLRTETGKLSSALTDTRQIGSWGEIQLRRIVEMAGMLEHCDFMEQETGASGERPDLVVKLPESRAVVVDAKASTAAYLEAQAAEDTEAVDAAMRRHAGALRAQVDDLAKKGYGAQAPGSLDFVVMFVPNDQFLAAALSANSDLMQYAMAKRVAIVTPASLISLLWTVANGWQRHRIGENAERIREAGLELHKRMEVFMGHYQKVGDRLRAAARVYNDSIGSYDHNVEPQGRRFAQLASVSEEVFAAPQGIEETLRASRHVAAIEGEVDGAGVEEGEEERARS